MPRAQVERIKQRGRMKGGMLQPHVTCEPLTYRIQ